MFPKRAQFGENPGNDGKIESEVHNKCDFRRGDVMAQLLISGYMSDCKFVVGPDRDTAETVPGHKLLFALVSPTFESMFKAGLTECLPNAEIRITDIEPQHFKNFRYIIYNNDASILNTLSVEDVIQVYILSDKYLATAISDYILNFLTELLPKMPIDDVILMFQFSLGMDDIKLLEAVKIRMQLVDRRKSKRINDLSENEFYEYIHILREMNQSLEMFSTIERYFESNNLIPSQEELGSKSETKMENKDKDVKSPLPLEDSIQNKIFLTKCLKCINFGSISACDFKKGPGESKILTFEQKYFILSRLGDKSRLVLNV